MTINFKRINTKFLIIPLSLIMLGGVNNSIRAMDENYGKENHVNTNNNNNIINNNKLKEHIKFSDFKKLVKLLSKYNSVNENDKKEIYRKCTDFIKLLPQFIQNDANSVSFNRRCINFTYVICRKLTKLTESETYKTDMNRGVITSIANEIIGDAGKQFGIKLSCLNKINNNNVRDIIDELINDLGNSKLKKHIEFSSNEICLNYLLDYSVFRYLFEDDFENDVENYFDVSNAYNNFLKILKEYSENFSREEYIKILRIMLNNCISYCLRSDDDFVNKILRHACNKKFKTQFYDLFELLSEESSSDGDVYGCILFDIIPELARVEYNNYPHTSMPVNTISNKIMNDSIMPCIKKYVLELCNSLSSFYKNKISKQNQIILDLEKSQNKKDQDKVKKAQKIMKKYYELQNKMPEFTKHLINILNNKDVINQFQNKFNVNNIVYGATKDLRKEEIMNTFSKKAKVGDKKITSKYVVKQINDYAGKYHDGKDIVVKVAEQTSPVVKQEENENKENKGVNINNKNEKK